jgi:hypothetical protein
VRVRTFELRLIAAALCAGWTLTAFLVLLAYRPGGPLDLLVGLTAGLPILVAVAALVWPPVAREGNAFAWLVWLGLGTLLVLAPSIAGVLGQLLARGPQTLLPSAEAAYPWVLALLGTSLFSGLGVARATLGGSALRRRRLARGALIAVVATAGISLAFSGAAVGNEVALRDRPVAGSRFGPANPALELPTCAQPVRQATSARVDVELAGDVDGAPLGTVDVVGVRRGDDYRWVAYVATSRELGQHGAARIGDSKWRLDNATGWQLEPPGATGGREGLDRAVLAAAIEGGTRPAAEMLGISYFEGARARHCRVAIDGPAFEAAFPDVRRLVGDVDLRHWRGELDYWVFADGELGRASGRLSGPASGIVEGGLQARVRATMIAIERDRSHAIVPPTH